MHSDGSGENEGASAPGVAFAYETAKWQIEKQEQALREVNSRLAFLIAGLLGFSTYYFQKIDPSKNPIETIVFGVALGLPVLLAGIGYIPRGYTRPPHPRSVAEEALNPPGAIREMVLGTMLEGFELNRRVINLKAIFFASALVLGLLVWLAGIGFKVYDASYTLIESRAHEQGNRPSGCNRAASQETRQRGIAENIRACSSGSEVYAQGARLPG